MHQPEKNAIIANCYCGCRQVVRHELPKLAFAGSSPVTRSKRASTTSTFGWALCFSRDKGLEPMRWEAVKQTRRWRVCRPKVRARKREDAGFREAKAGVPSPAPIELLRRPPTGGRCVLTKAPSPAPRKQTGTVSGACRFSSLCSLFRGYEPSRCLRERSASRGRPRPPRHRCR